MCGTMPKVSVIIPTYKRDPYYLNRAIKSVLEQSYENVEIVVVDDNISNSVFRGKTQELMSKYVSNPKIIYIRNKVNLGGALARNEGINASTGDYITFLDDDDEYLPSKIEKQIEFMINEDCDLALTDLMLVNSSKECIDYRSHNNLTNFNNDFLLKYHLMRHLTGTPTFMYKAGKLKEIGGFEDAKVGQEFYLMLKSIESGLKIRYLNRCDVLAYRHNEGGISQGTSKIVGEKKLFEFKKKYFHMFTLRERMFVRFRYNAVLAVSYLRNRAYLKSVGRVFMMIISSPFDSIIEVSKYIHNVIKVRKVEG